MHGQTIQTSTSSPRLFSRCKAEAARQAKRQEKGVGKMKPSPKKAKRARAEYLSEKDSAELELIRLETWRLDLDTRFFDASYSLEMKRNGVRSYVS